MEKSDPSLMRLSDPVTALRLLSRLPLPLPGPSPDMPRQAGAAWAYPLVGLLLGGLAAAVGLAATGLGLPNALAALLALGTLVMASGAMHEDGLADMADGLWGGWDRATRLEIMRDSRIGTYGVVALCLGLGARWAALWLLFDIGPGAATAAILASAALSRASLPVLMAALPHARGDGLSHQVGQVGGVTAAIGLGLALVVALALLGAAVVWPVIWAVLAVGAVALLAHQKIGGQTGDILGASQQIAEIAVLFSLLS